MRPTNRTAATLLATLACATLPPTAHAQSAPPAAKPTEGGQSPAELRQEIERLRQEAGKRQADLDAALARIKELEKQLADAKAAPSGAAPAGTAPAAAPAPIPADPTIGPGGLQSSMLADYLAAFPEVPEARDQQRFSMHLRALEAWCTKANRDNVRPCQWTGRIVGGTVSETNRVVTFTANFRNGTREFKVPCSMSPAAFAKVRGLGQDQDVVFAGVAKPRLAVNPRRPAPNAFDVPPLLAPYVEFVFDFEVKSATPASAAAPK